MTSPIKSVLRSAALAVVAAMTMATNAIAADKLSIAINTGIYGYLPFFVAVEKGYFKDEGIDLEIQPVPGDTAAVMPMLARGDFDLIAASANPSLFNARAEGFNIRLIGVMNETDSAWSDVVNIMIRKDLVDSGRYKDLSDLKGLRVDGAAKGSAPSFWVDQLLKKAGLTQEDVEYTERLRTPPDFVAALMNNAVDVVPVFEPGASKLEQDGTAVRLAGQGELMSGLQTIFVASSEKALSEHRDALVRALKAMLRAHREVYATHGKWTPELKQIAAKYTKNDVALFDMIPGPVYATPTMVIDPSSLMITFGYQKSRGLVEGEADLEGLIDNSLIEDASEQLDTNN